MQDKSALNEQQKDLMFKEIYLKSDRFVNYTLFAMFGFGLFLAPFYGTFWIAIVCGGLSLAAYYIPKIMLPGTTVYQYVLSFVLGIFSAQYIYQMHGMFEMHFFFFVASTVLITYQNWRLQLPLLLFVVIHHGTFAYLQYTGMKEIYFTQLDYMDLQTFLFHAVIAGVIIFICGYWAYDLEARTRREFITRTAFQSQLKHVKSNMAFAEAISQGNLNYTHEVADDDELGQSLQKMQRNLLSSYEREQADKYIATGLANIGDILRKNSLDFQELSDQLVSYLVRYLEANQGAIYLLSSDESDPMLELTSCYAYDRKKFLSTKFGIGEGMIGQCFQEREMVYITDVPDGFVRITSGLGTANPRCIVLMPLIANEEVHGVMEFASFNTMRSDQLDFLKSAGELIASSIVSTRTTERIRMLLEESQQRGEEMRAQEEEMRQNMEELQATQEEMTRRNTEMERGSYEYKTIATELDELLLTAEFSPEGYLSRANAKFGQIMDRSVSDLKGSLYKELITLSSSGDDQRYWNKLQAGERVKTVVKLKTPGGKQVEVTASLVPMVNDKHQVYKILLLAQPA